MSRLTSVHVQGVAWVSHLGEHLGVEGVKLQTATKGVEEMQTKLNDAMAEKERAEERANSADQALAVERSLRDQMVTESNAKDLAIKDLEKKVQAVEKEKKELEDRVRQVEREKKEAEDLALKAQMENFRLGYDDAVAQAKLMGLEYKKLLLNPNVDTTLVAEVATEGADETPELES